MEKILCPSMMCVNYDTLATEIRDLEEAGVDMFHCDVMDGSFVPNFTMGLLDIMAIRKNTKKMIDCHLMIENPGDKIQLFLDAGVDLIYIHPEAEIYTSKTLQKIRDAGKLAGIAINPDTSISTIYEILHTVDYILVMTVNPGFAGQKYLSFVDEKIEKLVELKEKFGYKIIMDGGCSPEKIEYHSARGVDGFVLGTSALFGKDESYSEIMTKLRQL